MALRGDNAAIHESATRFARWITAVGLVTAASAGLAASAPQPIHFEAGATRAVVQGAVVRGERSLYSLTADAGQHLSITIKSLEKNAVFQVHLPGSQTENTATGVRIVGATLGGAGEGDDATHWQGVLEVSGVYTIVVGSTRGNSTFRLTVRLR